MAAGDTVITLIGNLVDDPELRFTPTGQAVARFRLASTPRFMDRSTNEWKDGDSLFLTCNVWRQMGENVAESLQRGMRVILQGRLKQRTYETKEGDKRTVYEVEVDEIGPSMRHATAKVVKVRGSRTVNTPPQNPWDGMPAEDQDADPASGEQAPVMAGAGAYDPAPEF
ncbi:single-stranded DNA-binding protein [Nonomuraea sp. 3N208]|uniref:single-stranded DNA-binding protein n=1 Tax=Nonomuraea sp. 3N208 TaxID=3457421 RepID=UPI003FD4B765